MKTDLDSSFLDDALAYTPRDLKHALIDSLACGLHNTGYALQGNTAESDVRWFARRMWEHAHWNHDGPGFDHQPEEERERWRAMATSAIAALPEFQMRIASRLIEFSKVARDIERSLRPERRRAPGREG